MAKPRLAVVLALLLSLLGLNFATAPAVAAPDEVSWSRFSIPTEGKPGNWLLAGGSDVRLLTMATSGSLYAYVPGLAYNLYKSTDGGYSWQETGNITGAIVDIVATDDAGIIYYATASNVYKSTDAGQSFFPLTSGPGGAGSGNIEITAIDVARLGGNNIIVIGTRDTDAGQYGGVYILDEGQPFSSWQDTNLVGFDVYAVASSPQFAADQQIVALVTDETDSFITTRIGGAGWGQTVGDARLDRDNSGASVVVAVSAAIAFPDDYSADPATGVCVQFVAVDTGSGGGDVYVIYGLMAPTASVAIDLNIGSGYGLGNIDVTSLQLSGPAASCRLLAGAAASGQVYRSLDGGASWLRSAKEPTGQAQTYLLMAPDFITGGKAYAATSGSGSAFSVTVDGGATWNQVGLIDTAISSIVDLAVSPNYDQDSSLFMLSWGSQFSLWRSLDGGASWQRVFSSSLAGVDSLDLVQLAPGYGGGHQVVFVAGSGGGAPAIWKSADNGQSFIGRSVPLPVDQWLVTSDTSLFLSGFDGGNGLVFSTTNSGLIYSSSVVGSHPLTSLALSPNYGQDGVVLAGNANGWVYWSNDRGASFESLPPGAVLPPLSGNISVAFDPQFSGNSTIYATSDAPDAGIYRFVIGSSTGWQGIDGSLPSGGMVGGLTISAEGTLYAANFQQVDTANQKGGLERSLNPAHPLGATFETVIRGLDDGATLWGLWLHGHQIWSIDTTNAKLMTYYDSLTQPVSLTWPLNQAPGIGVITGGTVANVSLDWEPLSGATSYQWQLDDDNDFSSIPPGFEGTVTASSVRLPVLQPAATYYWRVRVIGPVLSLWSAKWSFTTSLGGGIVAPQLESPEAGARDVPLSPVFQWTAVAAAEGYELLVSGEADFLIPVIVRIGEFALPTNAWQSDITLTCDTTYYWKVRAVSSLSYSAWSAVGAFTIQPPPAESEPPPQSPPQPAQQSPVLADWAVYIMVFLAATIVLLLVTILVMVARRH